MRQVFFYLVESVCFDIVDDLDVHKVRGEDLLGGASAVSEVSCAVLAHSDAVSPSLSDEDEVIFIFSICDLIYDLIS